MKKTILTIALTSIISFPALAAVGDNVPHSFSNGTPADANQVNANFAEVVTQISTLSASGVVGPQGEPGTAGVAGDEGVGVTSIVDDGAGNLTINLSDGSSSVHIIPSVTTYSYRDFGHTFSQKTFAVTDTRNKYDSEIRIFDRSVSGRVSYTRERLLNTNRIKYNTIMVDNSGPELLFVEFKSHDNSSLAVTNTQIINNGLISRTENMEIGKTFGSDATVVSSNGAVDAYTVQTSSLLSVNQSVTVPAGSFTGCIKVARHRSGNTLGTTNDLINTFCPGVGLVKQVFSKVFYNTSSPSIRTEITVKELSSCNGGACVLIS